MSEHREFNPNVEAAKAHLKSIAERGPVLMTDVHHGAIHGTSLEAIRRVVEIGGLRGHSYEEKYAGGTEAGYLPGDVFAYPTMQIFDAVRLLHSPTIMQKLIHEPDELMEYAKLSANRNGRRHAFLTSLHIPFSDDDASTHAESLFDQADADEIFDAEEYFGNKGFSGDQLNDALAAGRNRRGFLLGFSPDITTSSGLTVMKGDADSHDIRIRTGGKGLGFQFISGIEALGPEEQSFLEQL